MKSAPIIINYFGNSTFICSEIKIAENMNITEKKEKIMTQIKADTVGNENPLKAEAFHLLHQIFGSGDETLINYATIQLRLLAGKV